jgi:hypothetical protein
MSPIIKVFGEELFAIKETNSGNELEMFFFIKYFFVFLERVFPNYMFLLLLQIM